MSRTVFAIDIFETLCLLNDAQFLTARNYVYFWPRPRTLTLAKIHLILCPSIENLTTYIITIVPKEGNLL